MFSRTTAVLLLATAGCSGEKGPAAQPAIPAPPAPTPATITLADFRHLSYLDGDWRGTMANGSSFFERYRVADDSTIVSYGIKDSTFAVTDSSAIRWSNGQVRSGSDGRVYVATVWTADSVRFEPESLVQNSFIWIRESPDAWTAHLYPLGSTSVTTYSMKRVR